MIRSDVLSSALEIASEQGGYLTTAQAKRLDISDQDIQRLVSSGDLVRVRRGVLRMRHANPQHEAEIAAWLHFEKGRLPWERRGATRAVISHDSAAALQNLGSIIPLRPSVTVTERRGSAKVADIDVHFVTLAPEDWKWLSLDQLRIPVTKPARTIIDLLIGGHEPSYLRRATAEAKASDGLTSQEMYEAADRRLVHSTKLRSRIDELLSEILAA